MSCNGLTRSKTVFDCVHGYINLTLVEKEVIDTLVFQRLHNIKQLGLAYLVYPTAQHTRFSHSLGTLHVVSEFIDAIRIEYPEAPQFHSKDKIQELRLAALLHDIGHHPFSHVIEDVIKDPKLDGAIASHTTLTKHIIENTSIEEKISDFDFKNIQSMITKNNDERAYNSLISSGLDADRLDYLVRDSYFTGVAYGSIDIPRIMKIVRLVDNDIAYDLKGLPTIENYIMALMSMYWAVYYHETITGFNLLLGRIYQELREQNILPSFDEILVCDETELYGYNDTYLLNVIRQRSRENSRIGEMCDWFINRKPLKIIDWDRVYKKGTEARTRLSPLGLPGKLSSVSDESGISENNIFHATQIRSFMKSGDLVQMYDSKLKEPIQVAEIDNSALCDLVGKAYFEDRVYTAPDYDKDTCEKLRDAINNQIKQPD